jgi:hypothetical protein
VLAKRIAPACRDFRDSSKVLTDAARVLRPQWVGQRMSMPQLLRPGTQRNSRGAQFPFEFGLLGRVKHSANGFDHNWRGYAWPENYTVEKAVERPRFNRFDLERLDLEPEFRLNAVLADECRKIAPSKVCSCRGAP